MQENLEGIFLLVIDVGMPNTLWVGTSLCAIRKQAEQAIGSKPVSITPLHQFLPPGSYCVLVPILTSSMASSYVEAQAE